MATISKELAEKEVKRLKTQKQPKVYCILRYWNNLFNKENYASCNNEVEYQAVVGSGVSEVKILWASDRFLNPEKRRKEVAKAKKTEELRRALGLL